MLSKYDRFASVDDLSMALKRCICEGKGFVYAPVPIGHKFYGKAIPCVCRRNEEQKRRAERLRAKSGLSNVARERWTFETFDPDLCLGVDGKPSEAVSQRMRALAAQCYQYAKDPKGWLILVGRYGCGKTHLAVAILNESLRRGRACYFSTAPDMLEMLRATFSTGQYDQWNRWLQEVPLLILDDLGSEHGTGWAREALYRLINFRYVNTLPMVLTSNEHPKVRAQDSRLWSRICDGSETPDGWARILSLPAGDYRLRRRMNPVAARQ